MFYYNNLKLHLLELRHERTKLKSKKKSKDKIEKKKIKEREKKKGGALLFIWVSSIKKSNSFSLEYSLKLRS